jgi:hypothetical protein
LYCIPYPPCKGPPIKEYALGLQGGIEDLCRRAACKLSSAKFKGATQSSMQSIEDLCLPLSSIPLCGIEEQPVLYAPPLQPFRVSMLCIEDWVAPWLYGLCPYHIRPTPLQPPCNQSSMLCIEDWLQGGYCKGPPVFYAEHRNPKGLQGGTFRVSMLCIEDWWPPLYGGHPYSKEYGGRHANLAL